MGWLFLLRYSLLSTYGCAFIWKVFADRVKFRSRDEIILGSPGGPYIQRQVSLQEEVKTHRQRLEERSSQPRSSCKRQLEILP